MEINICPCCGSSEVLRHARREGLYWVCRTCRQEVLPLNLTQPRISLSDRLTTLNVRPLQSVN